MDSITQSVSYDRRGRVAVLLVDNPPVNALSQHVRQGLDEGIARAADDEQVDAVVIACAGRTFIAGADITEFGKPPQQPGLREVLDHIEACPKPVVAAIFGTALGGGHEVALCCHYRIAVPSAKLGLPEVKLGLLPGAGGTQRLPRVVGVKKALEMVTSGNPISAGEAHRHGLVDQIVEEDPGDGLVDAAVSFAEKAVAEGRPLVKIRDRDEKLAEARQNPQIFDEFRRKIARKTRGFEAPEANIRCIEAAVSLPFDEGMTREGELFAELMQGEQSKAQRYYFFAEREAAKIPDVPKDTPRREIASCGIVGAGTMGGGIAMNFANAGIPVIIVERDQEALDRGLGVVRKNYDRTASKGRISAEDVEQRMGLFSPTTDYQRLADCDIVVEAVFEDMELKKEVFGQLDAIVKQGAILATNTSALDVDEIAASTDRPADVIGLHFFSPANVMRLLEMVRGAETAKDVIATCMDLSKRIGKIAVLVGVCRGFVGNRMLFMRRIEANRLILEGATPWQVDRVIYDFGFPMGPFAMSDLAGLDIGWKRETSSSSTIREVLCERGRLGQKSGSGYYVYDRETRAAAPDPEVEELIEEFSAKEGIERREVSDQEILERCLYPMVNEGAKILEEGIAIRASDIDVVWVNGYGWPVYRGGPMFWADGIGLGEVAQKIRHYAEKLGGDHWQLSPLLERLSSEGKTFTGR
ncbi:MAG TPA: 3-hydroxyacyl-CoA dehydrogenase NAD-binding domain-containing protein [Thermoanaerobaculia bacterium]|nr:3-hydroxyacyl-CoA dehydrogenase NAD-binding domain-containing protein [Thermoanaerobaculia bacterium]